MKSTRTFLVLALVLALAAPAYAETQNVKVSGSLDMYGFYRNDFDLRDKNDAGSQPSAVDPAGTAGTLAAENAQNANQQSDSDEYFMSITQLQVSADLTDNVSTVINVLNQRDWNADDFVSGGTNANTTTNTAPNAFDLQLDLAYVQLKEAFYSPLTLTIGRQDLLFGRGFNVGWNPQDPEGVIQANEFTALQAFDAIRGTLDFAPWTVDLVYSKINENAHNPEDDRDLYIVNFNYKFAEYNAVAEGYYVGEADRSFLSGTTGTRNNDTHTVGGRVQFDPISQMTLGGELAYQFGNYRALVTAVARDREASAVDLFGEYRFEGNYKPMLGAQYVYLSGESDLSAGATAAYGAWNGSFRGPIYGWIHDYLEVYYLTAAANDQAAGQNQQHLSLYGSIQPLDDLKLTGAWWYFWATDDMHTVTNQPTSPAISDDIGNEVNLSAIYNYTEDVSFTLMANWFIPGELYSSPNDSTATELVSQVRVAF